MKVFLSTVEAWCRELVLKNPACLPSSLVQMHLKVLDNISGSRRVVDMAKELAGTLVDMPYDQRSALDESLVQKFGFGLDFFMDKRLVKLRAVLSRGKIATESEFRLLDEFVSDVESPEAVRVVAEDILAAYYLDKS